MVFRHGWKIFEWHCYYDYLTNSGTFPYYVNFSSIRGLFSNINVRSLISDFNMSY